MLLPPILNYICDIVYCQSNYKIFFCQFKFSTEEVCQFKITMTVLPRHPLPLIVCVHANSSQQLTTFKFEPSLSLFQNAQTDLKSKTIKNDVILVGL